MIRVMLLMLISAQVMAADFPGRLFYTSQQRAVKKTHGVKQSIGAIAYQGYVKRSDGVDTQWVNGQSREVDGRQDIKLLKQVGVPSLKVGQYYDVKQHKVSENYEQEMLAPVDNISPWQPPQLDDHDAPDSQQ
ncbi:hypothetical protein [Sulfuriferula nivalis]|uniref:Uncharacterized protein n=1 Tax=Sulfuriferula nivalis TaxID=2675298 RepID=A0A809RJQ5_9PROT|nr:hypothetical protein [Sulfuriferula nivalis]BBP02149.1 hypothetical protein SFSGTM_28570 [Sulfuriferula nivalis]